MDFRSGGFKSLPYIVWEGVYTSSSCRVGDPADIIFRRAFVPPIISCKEILGGEDLSTALNIINFSYLLLTKSRKYAMFVLK